MSNTIIRIKRSGVTGVPAALKTAELAYSYLSGTGSNGGDRLYIGTGDDGMGNATTVAVIGGKFFTDMLDHEPGVLTASSAIIVDENKKVNQLLVDDIELNGNVISSTSGLVLKPTGSLSINDAYTLPTSDGNTGQALVTNGSGSVTFTTIPYNLNLTADATDGTVPMNTSNLTIIGGTGISTAVSGNAFTITGRNASTTQKGVAAFATTDFQFLTAGNVSLANVNTDIGSYGSATAVPVFTVDGKGRVTAVTTAAISTDFTIAADNGSQQTFKNGNVLFIVGTAGQGISTTVSSNTITITAADASTTQKGTASFNTDNFTVTSGAVSTKAVTIGTTAINSGASSTTLAGLTQVDINNIRLTGSTISTTDTNGDLILDPNGAGNVNVNSSRIVNVTDPLNPQDAATKAYVDAVKTGLDVKNSVRATTTANIALSGTQTIDDVSLVEGNRVLVKNQGNAAENGIYIVASGAWSRASDADNTPGTGEVTAGMFTFVEEGTQYADSGWVLTTNGSITLDTTELTFVQFSGAGQIVAGDGLTKLGNRLDVVGTADRITVNADSVDISANYVGQTSITTLGTITTGTWTATTIAPTRGGTGHTTYNVGDILVATSSNAFVKLSVGAEGKVLQSNGTTVAYGDIDGGAY